MSSYGQKPDADEVEVTVFGPGYGEAIVAHLGNNEWIAVDSRNCSPGQPFALEYLSEIGVSAEAVKLVVASHWHADHTQGLSEILRCCKNARFVCSQALQPKQFCELVALAGRGPAPANPFAEMRDCLEVVRSRGQAAVYAASNRVLLELPNADVRALSPADASIQLALARFAQAFNQPHFPVTLPPNEENDCSVVLAVSALGIRFLLGGDLEQRNVPNTGWNDVVSLRAGMATFSAFKVPHHGSENGHNQRVWDEMLDFGLPAVLTPFRKGRTPIPKRTDRDRICGLTEKAYITAPPAGTRYRDPDRFVVNTLREMSASAPFLATKRKGVVRLRRRMREQVWSTSTFGEAMLLNQCPFHD